MLEFYKETKFTPKSLRLIEICKTIIERYQEQGIMLTLRQLYYQLVSADVIPNKENSYKALSGLIANARLAGLIDWAAIEDRMRKPKKHAEFSGVEQLVQAALYSYRLPRWEGQDNYVELWVEKDALASVLAPIADEYHITLMVNRGYASISSMYDSAARFKEFDDGERSLHLLYLGDLDPSGEDMVRDVRDRLSMFQVDPHVTKIALTMEQVEEYKPPPNPAKKTDSRFAKYAAEFGSSSWEVDALPPEKLRELIVYKLDDLVDQDKVDAIVAEEELDKTRLRNAAKKIEKSKDRD